MKKLFVIWLGCMAVMGLPAVRNVSLVRAYSEFLDDIPNSSIFGCVNCHGSGYSINQFGLDYSHGGHLWDGTLAGKDSDGDGFSNGVELQDPSGAWRPGDPAPGDPEAVTNPGDPGSHPSEPTATPTVVPPTPTPSPTEPAGCVTTGVTITMPSHVFYAGDICNCHAIVCNKEGYALEGYPLFVLLDVYGTYFFAPSFNPEGDNYLDSYPRFEEGETDVTVLNDFTWPETGAPSSGPVCWFAALTDPGVSQLFGEMGTFDFEWY